MKHILRHFVGIYIMPTYMPIIMPMYINTHIIYLEKKLTFIYKILSSRKLTEKTLIIAALDSQVNNNFVSYTLHINIHSNFKNKIL